uniref:hypothetical protein n=1 Tax=Salmonella sp. SAL4436 TaxID=3159891 RepID=UPI00397E07EA
ALGCVLTDLVLVPRFGLQRTQLAAAGLNVVAAVIAMTWAGRAPAPAVTAGPAGLRAKPSTRSSAAPAASTAVVSSVPSRIAPTSLA